MILLQVKAVLYIYMAGIKGGVMLTISGYSGRTATVKLNRNN